MCGGDPIGQNPEHPARKLFPACAGVIPTASQLRTADVSFPRVCGGDPAFIQKYTLCSALFPACAGVILLSEIDIVVNVAFPRVCGGDPGVERGQAALATFSPRVRFYPENPRLVKPYICFSHQCRVILFLVESHIDCYGLFEIWLQLCYCVPNSIRVVSYMHALLE